MDNFLDKRKNQISTSVELLMEHTRDWQTIKAYINNRLEVELTAEQQKKYDRYQFIYNNICSGKYGKAQILEQVQRFFNIARTQAYEDYNATQEIFTSTISINKILELYLQLETCKELQRKSAAAGDFRAAAAFGKNIIAINKEIPEVENNLADLFEGHNFEVTFDPALLGAPAVVDMQELLTKINVKRKVKIKMDFLNAEDINHEDVNE